VSDGLDKILESLNKRYGKAVINNADEIKYPAVERIRTGSLAIDIEIGGGIPRGRVTMIVANESAGKTTLALHIIKQAQKQNGRILFVDAEGTFDPEWAKVIGVDLSKLIVAVPDVGEQAADIIEAGIRSNECSLIVLDSIAALMPAAELEKPMIETTKNGEHEGSPEQIGDRALMLNRATRRLTSALNAITEQGERNTTAVILLNQFREKIGAYGNPEVIPGGKGIKFMSSIILELRKPGGKDGWIEEDRNGETIKIGQEIKFKTQKNKTYAPFRTGVTYLLFDGPMKGQIDVTKELYVYGRLLGLIPETAQAVFTIDGKKFRGQKQVEDFLRVNPKYCEKLEKDIRDRYLKGR
jgi:recombination protein RecA